MRGAHLTQREAEDEAEGHVVRERVCQDHEQHHKLCEMRSCCESPYMRWLLLGRGSGGVLEGAVEHESGRSTEAA